MMKRCLQAGGWFRARAGLLGMWLSVGVGLGVQAGPEPVGASAAKTGGADQQVMCPAPATPLTREGLQAVQRTGAADRGMLWSVEKDGRRSWLYGTMHLGRPEWLAIGPQLQHALQRSDVLALEVDLTDSRTLSRLQSRSEVHLAHRGQALPPSEASRVHQQLRKLCLHEQALSSTAPHMQAAALVVLAARHEGLYAEYGSERVLATLAKAQRKRVVAVEDPSEQMQLLKGKTSRADVEQLQAALDELESGSVLFQLRQLGEVWGRGDVAKLARYNEWCDCIHSEADREAQRRLLDERNRPMADAFDRLHGKGESVLMAVGALHMVGESGLVQLLKRRGYHVMHVSPATPLPMLAH